jgi:Ca-activated chloride channel family protein
VTLTAPAVAGRYSILLVAGADRGEPPIPGGGEVLAGTTIEIVAADIRLDVAAPVVAGRSFRVAWSGPGGRDDEIRLAAPEMSADIYLAVAAPLGEAVTLFAPGTAGTYEVRYWSAAAQEVLAVRSIEIAAAAAGLEAPAEVVGGATFEVVWTGDAAIGDHLAIVRPSGGEPGIVYSVRVSLFGRPTLVDAPIAAGTYELVYLTRAGDEPIARLPLTVTAPVAGLVAPTVITAGEPVEVEWQGPGGRFDEIRIVDAAGETVGAAPTIANPALLTAPAAPGTYKIQYWAGTAAAALATIEIVVNCPDCPAIDAGAAPG